MPTSTYPIAQLPNGIVATNDALAAIDVSTLTENVVVQTLGRNAVNDGGAGTFYFAAGSSATVDNQYVVTTPSTGRWLAATNFSGVGPVTSSLTGYRETFAILSGFAPVVYTLPPVASVGNKAVTVITATTGTATIRTATPTEFIYGGNGGAATASVVTTLTGNQSFTFQPYGNNYYRIDTRWGL